MALTLTFYPVDSSGNKIRNALSGFNPIELGFSNAGSPEIKGVEVFIASPTDFDADLLGFNLYSDFFNLEAVVDVSIIVDKTNQAPVLEPGVIDASRIKFRVKYRAVNSDNSVGSWVELSAEQPIIAVHSIKQSDLDIVLNDSSLPKIYKGYPNLIDFLHSDANELGLNIVTKYDLIAIDNTVISSDNQLYNFGIAPFGILNTSTLPSEDVATPFANGGAAGTTDWINPTNGVAEGWALGGDNTGAIITGNGFTGNAQQTITNGNSNPLILYDGVPETPGSVEVNIFFKYRSSRDLRLYVGGILSGAEEFDFTSNEVDAIQAETGFFIPAAGVLAPDFSFSQAPFNGDYIEIDDVYYVVKGTDPVDLNGAYFDLKIISE